MARQFCHGPGAFRSSTCLGYICFSSGFMGWWQVGGDRGGLLVLTGHVSVHATSLQSRLTLCCPMDCSPPGSSVRGILWASILEWVAISCSRISSGHRDRTHASCIGSQILYQLGHLGSTLGQLVSSAQPLSRVGLFGTPWAAAHQASLSITNSWSQSWLLNYTLGQ